MVTHLQTKKWVDFSAPKDTKIMRDLVQKTRNLTANPADPILVHCSAGVGRSGTFIAVYKLIEEYLDSEKKVLDVYSTVMEMRGQRMKMVQKPPQYVYIFKCLRDEIISEKADGHYYEI